MMKFFAPFVHFLFRIGYFGPLVMGVLDSSFLVLPFGNDLLIVNMVARHHQGIAWFVLSAACGSTIGTFLLAVVSRKLGEEGIRRIGGDARYEKLKKRIGQRSGIAVALAGLAPPPFPFTMVIAAVSALGYSLWKLLFINFLARGLRFTILSILALKFGREVVRITRSAPFEWGMVAFIAVCLIASVFSVIHWFHKPQKKSDRAQAAD
jgi:membrane protein YqaA with SNARE-associated domain